MSKIDYAITETGNGWLLKAGSYVMLAGDDDCYCYPDGEYACTSTKETGITREENGTESLVITIPPDNRGVRTRGSYFFGDKLILSQSLAIAPFNGSEKDRCDHYAFFDVEGVALLKIDDTGYFSIIDTFKSDNKQDVSRVIAEENFCLPQVLFLPNISDFKEGRPRDYLLDMSDDVIADAMEYNDKIEDFSRGICLDHGLLIDVKKMAEALRADTRSTNEHLELAALLEDHNRSKFQWEYLYTYYHGAPLAQGSRTQRVLQP